MRRIGNGAWVTGLCRARAFPFATAGVSIYVERLPELNAGNASVGFLPRTALFARPLRDEGLLTPQPGFRAGPIESDISLFPVAFEFRCLERQGANGSCHS
jgi:hypothetical protein